MYLSRLNVKVSNCEARLSSGSNCKLTKHSINQKVCKTELLRIRSSTLGTKDHHQVQDPTPTNGDVTSQSPTLRKTKRKSRSNKSGKG